MVWYYALQAQVRYRRLVNIPSTYNTIKYNITLLPSVNTIALECFVVPSTLITHSHKSLLYSSTSLQFGLLRSCEHLIFSRRFCLFIYPFLVPEILISCDNFVCFYVRVDTIISRNGLNKVFCTKRSRLLPD